MRPPGPLEGPKGRGLIESPGKVAVQPVGQCRQRKQHTGGENAPALLHHIKTDKYRNQENAGDRYKVR